MGKIPYNEYTIICGDHRSVDKQADLLLFVSVTLSTDLSKQSREGNYELSIN